jgi:drug/metabolite transporter (DMT)-like permease
VIGYRGAILALDSGSFVMRATTALVFGLALQTLVLTAWMLLFDRRALAGSIHEWRSSLFAGFLGALASQFWFIAFSLTAAANVRTLALVEIVMAQMVSRRLAQATSRREIAGMGLVLLGVALLVWSSR